MMQHLPILHVILPLVAAALCALVRNGNTAWVIASLTCWAVFAVGIMLLFVAIGQPLSYALGDWLPPQGIEYHIDSLSAFVIALVAGLAAITMPYAAPACRQEIAEEKQPLFYSVFLLCVAGLLGIASTNDIFNIFVFLEISSLATYALIAMGKDRRALVASFEYLVLGTIGATFYLIGIGILYMLTGTLNIDDLALRLPTITDTRAIQAAAAFITVGLGLKIALFPLHLWLTNAYTYAPSFVSAFLAGTATKVSIYVLLRLLFNVFGIELAFNDIPLAAVLFLLAVAGILLGSFTAIFQRNIKRMLAFSSVAQVGYIILGVALVSPTGIAAGLVHLFNHALAKGALFLAVGAVFLATGGVRIEHFRGIAKFMPWTMGAFIMAGLSLIGIPGTAGFISKWMLIQALMEQEHWLMVGIVVLSSLLAAMYVWRVVEAAYFQPSAHAASSIREAHPLILTSAWVLGLAGIYFGLETSWSLGVAMSAADSLLAGRL